MNGKKALTTCLLLLFILSGFIIEKEILLDFRLGSTKKEYKNHLKQLVHHQKIQKTNKPYKKTYKYLFYTKNKAPISAIICPGFGENNRLSALNLILQRWEYNPLSKEYEALNYTCKEVESVYNLYKEKYGDPDHIFGSKFSWSSGDVKITFDKKESSVAPFCSASITYTLSDSALKNQIHDKRKENINDI